MITKLALYLSETIFYSCDEFSVGEFSASCFSTSYPPSIFDQLFSASCFRRVFLDSNQLFWQTERQLQIPLLRNAFSQRASDFDKNS